MVRDRHPGLVGRRDRARRVRRRPRRVACGIGRLPRDCAGILDTAEGRDRDKRVPYALPVAMASAGLGAYGNSMRVVKGLAEGVASGRVAGRGVSRD